MERWHERSKSPDLKSGEPDEGSVGSNPTLSAKLREGRTNVDVNRLGEFSPVEPSTALRHSWVERVYLVSRTVEVAGGVDSVAA